MAEKHFKCELAGSERWIMIKPAAANENEAELLLVKLKAACDSCQASKDRRCAPEPINDPATTSGDRVVGVNNSIKSVGYRHIPSACPLPGSTVSIGIE